MIEKLTSYFITDYINIQPKQIIFKKNMYLMMKKKWTKFSKELVNTLLIISESQYSFTSHTSFKIFKIILYFFQLQGYVYSQYESKPLLKSDLIYFTSFTQNASMTFWLFTLEDDQISMVVFYVVIASHILLYVMIIIFSIIKIDMGKLVYGIWNFFFLNFIWIFLTPLQEVSIGMIVCGSNSFIKTQKQSRCYVSPFDIFLGSVNTILILFSGFMSLYFFRSYRFNSIDFLRKYEFKDLLYVILHQIIIIEYYLNFSFLDYAKHTMMHILFILLIYEALASFPFGFYLEAILYTVVVCLNEWFMVLLSIWLFSKLDSNFLFITFFIMIPIISGIAKFMVNNLNSKLMLNLQATKFNQNVDTYLEEIYRIAGEYYYNTQSKVKFMLIMKSHTNKCNNIKCPCTQNSQIFIDQSNNVSRERLNQWAQYVFDSALKSSLLRQKLYYYENFSLKYNTFLEQYQNNPILAYGILQDIMKNQSKRKQSNQLQVSFYFISLFYVLSRRYRQKIEQLHKKQQMTKFEYDLLNDIKVLQENQKRLINIARTFLKQQMDFWNRYKSSQYKDFNSLSKGLFNLVFSNKKFVKAFDFIDGQNNSIYILRLKILIQFCKDKNISNLEYLIKQLNSFIQEEHQDNDGNFKSIYFNNQRAISLVANISGINQGEIRKNSQANQFFSLHNNIELKNLNQIIPSQLAEQHKKVMENYIHSGYLSNNLNSIIKGYCLNGFGLIEPVNINITPYFQTQENEYNHFLMAHIMKQNIYNMEVSTQSYRKQGAILLSGTFQIIGITDYLFNKIMKHSKNIIDLKDFMQKISIFQLIPNLGDYLFEYYETKQKFNQKDFLNEEIGTFNTTLNYFLTKDLFQQYYTDFFSIKERVKILGRIRNECITEQVDLMYQEIKLQIKSNCFKYNNNYNLQFYPYYELIIETSKQNKIIKKHQKLNEMKKNELEIKQIQSSEQFENFDNVKKDHITLISERIFSENNAGVQLNESNLTSYLSSLSQNNQLSEFYKYVNLSNFKGVNLYFWSSIINLGAITIFTILLIVTYSQMLDNKSYCQEFQYKLFELNDQYTIIRHTIIHHQFIVENLQYVINNTINFQNSTLPLTKEDYDNIYKQQLTLALSQFQNIYQQSSRFFIEIMEDGDFLLLSYQVQNNKIITENIKTQQLLQILLQIFYDLNSNSTYQKLFTVARNYKPFVDNIMNIITKKCSYQLENSDSQQLLILLVFGYISIILIQIQLIYSTFQTNSAQKKVLKIFLQTDYQAACWQLYQVESFYNFFQNKNILYDGKSTDKFIQQQFKSTENQNYNIQGSNNFGQNEPQSFRDTKYKIEEINENLSAFWPLLIQCFIFLSNIMQFFIIQILISQIMSDYVQRVNYGIALNHFKSQYINILVDWDSIVYQNYNTENQFYFYQNDIANLQNKFNDFKNKLYHNSIQTDFLNNNCSDCLDNSRVFQQLNYKFLGINQDFITSSVQQIIENGYNANASIINQQDYFIYYIWGFDYIINILNNYSTKQQNEIFKLLEYLQQEKLKLLMGLLLVFFFANISLLLIINIYQKTRYYKFLQCLRFVPAQIVLKFKLNQKLRELI
ncbi:hypothetical protein pb186bvf_013396 [Paramecium bursaria]